MASVFKGETVPGRRAFELAERRIQVAQNLENDQVSLDIVAWNKTEHHILMGYKQAYTVRRHDTKNNDIQHNDTQHNSK